MWDALKFKNLKKYLIASFINTLIGICLIVFVYRITNQELLTIGLCSLIGYFYSILTYHRIAFNGKLSNPPYLKYAISYFSSFILNSTLTRIGEKMLSSFLVIQIFVVPLVVIIQWLTANLWVFRRKR